MTSIINNVYCGRCGLSFPHENGAVNTEHTCLGAMERVASYPQAGDVVRLRGGHVEYAVVGVVPGEPTIDATRFQVNHGPAILMHMSRETWADLIKGAASTVEVTPRPLPF